MKKYVMMAAMAAMTLSACQQQPANKPIYEQQGTEEVGTYTVHVIGDQIYHLEDYNTAYPQGTQLNDSNQVVGFNNTSDMYLLVGTESALLIDLSNDIKWADNAVESLQKVVADRIGNLPLTITFTHNHGDHTGMLPAFHDNKDVKFALPRIDFEAMADKFPEGQYSFFDEGYQFDLGGKVINSVLVPGHTHGSIVFFLEGENLAFTGDAIGSGQGVWIFSPEGFREYVQGVSHLMEYISDAKHGIDKNQLAFWGGHYLQRAGMDLPEGKNMGWTYLEETQELINQIGQGTAESKEVKYGMSLDAHFMYKNAGIVWNAQAAKEYQMSLQAK